MKELKFLFAIWKTNLLSAMEYRAAFLTQVIGMIINDFLYFTIWIIFFDRFKDVRGWGLGNMYVTYGVLAAGFGLMSLLFGNTIMLADNINKGRLDYYLSFPRPVLLHTISTRMVASGMGDLTFGFLCYALSGSFTWDGLLRFVLAISLTCIIFASFFILFQSLAFWFGMVSNFVGLAFNAILTFGIYPATIFDTYAKLILFTIIPSALVGAVPAEFINTASWKSLFELLIGASIFLTIAVTVFNIGLKRYESGSAIQVEV